MLRIPPVLYVRLTRAREFLITADRDEERCPCGVLDGHLKEAAARIGT